MEPKTMVDFFLPFFAFLEGTVFVPYPRYEKVSRRYILGR